jgi:rubrerythrin
VNKKTLAGKMPMSKSAKRYRLPGISMVLVSLCLFLEPSLNAQPAYNETICVLQTLYKDEIQALHNYLAYAEKAAAEKYQNIAKLFRTLAASETAHARNFGALLSALGAGVENLPQLKPEVSSTQKHLELSTALELEEIDNKYPQFIERINPENHAEAIRYIIYAWKAEKQHRELLKKIQSGTGIFFGLLTKKIEGSPSPYFVCQNCGSTLSEIPATTCPICGGPSANYIEIK